MADMGGVSDSLGWALLHSIWQVGLIAALIFAGLRLVRRDQPGLRYAIAYSGMVAALLAFVATFLAGLGTEPVRQVALAPPPENPLIAMLDRSTGMLGLAWATGFLLLGVRYAAMIRETQRLRRHGLSQVPSLWQKRLFVWAERLGAGRVRIFESALVETPLTVGTFKPLVLVPAGFFLRLPRDQAEAILVHELAHICRQDYFFGLLQALIVNVFFFHPAIYYLSRQVDLEREHACDARAALETGDRAALAKGLSRVAIDMHDRRIGFAMAARGRHAVVERIRRLGELRGRSGPDDRTPAVALAMLFGTGILLALAVDSRDGEEIAADAQAPAVMAISSDRATGAAAARRTEEWVPAGAAHAVRNRPEAHASAAKTQAVRPKPDPEPAKAPGDRMREAPAAAFSQANWSAEPSGMNLFRQAVFEVQNVSLNSRVAASGQCSQTRVEAADDSPGGERYAILAAARAERQARAEQRRARSTAEQAEARAERAAAAAERHAAIIERRQERREAMIERQQERREAVIERQQALREAAIERAQVLAERRAEMLVRIHEDRAERRERRLEALAEARAARIEAKLERQFDRQREREDRDPVLDISWHPKTDPESEAVWQPTEESSCPVVTISFVIEPLRAPMLPTAPAVHVRLAALG